MRFLLALALTALTALPAAARPLSTAEAEALATSVDRYLAAIGRADAPAIVAALPPRILNVFAGATGVESRKLEETLVQQTEAVMKGTAFRDLSAGLSALDATDAALDDGSAVTWVLVPTAFTTVARNQKTRHEQPLLALHEGEAWHFLRIDGPQTQGLAALAYPFLAETRFPAATTTAID